MILFEGLPGSGKSTSSQAIYLALRRAGQNVLWFAEDQRPHPLVDDTPLAEIGDPSQLAEYALLQWRRLATEARTSDSMLVFDAALFGMTLGTLLRADTALEVMTATVLAIEAEIADLDPVVVYLLPADVDAAFDVTLERRGDTWVTYFAGEISQSPYALARGETGVDLVRTYLKELDQVSNVAFGSLSCARHSVDPVDCDGNGPTGRIQQILGTGISEERVPAANTTEGLAGTYRCLEADVTISLRVDGPHLVVDQERGARLVHVDEGRFMVQGMPVDVWFETSTDRHLLFDARTANPEQFPRRWVRI